MYKIETAVKDAMIFYDVIRHSAEVVAWLDNLMKPIALFVRAQIYHDV